jgi:gamma-glutamylcyclotransferase (GGCT)/AIG2-like uncharacterized protein YtfP
MLHPAPGNDKMIINQPTERTNMHNQQLPIFVYGTLRPGCGNEGRWLNRATPYDDGKCFAIGIGLFGGASMPFPYASTVHGEQTVGCLIVPQKDLYDAVLADMDQLEGVPNHYQRTTVAVIVGDSITPAWIYTTADPGTITRTPYNDWNRRSEKKDSYAH